MHRRFVFSNMYEDMLDRMTVAAQRVPGYRYALTAEGDEGDAGGSGGTGEGGDKGDADASGGADAAQAADAGDAGKKGADAGDPGPAPVTSFKDALTSDATKAFAEGSPDVEHLTQRAVDLRAQLSTAIVPPGKDASDSDVAAYRKKIGVPAAADGYSIKMPGDQEATEVDTAFHTTLSETFHKLNVPTATAEALNAVVNDHTLALQEMVVEQDKKFAEASEAELRVLWPDNYDENAEQANRTMQAVFDGESFEEFRMLEQKDGTLVADSPLMLRAFAVLGQQMKAGGLSATLSEGEMEANTNEIEALRAKQTEASDRGDTKAANRFYQQEQDLLRKTGGNQGVVGSQGRVA